MDAVGVDRAESADEREMSFAPTEEGMENWYDSCVYLVRNDARLEDNTYNVQKWAMMLTAQGCSGKRDLSVDFPILYANKLAA